ncbi:MAG TPA: Stp1/IreP family PP2C-type Ser/Thr phosphatase [Gaiellaceae bacterium]|jgi:serine/threonine protein phosphatase PrpC|nr:Stp1/IreP family PP2C-type Ser/Thr phosphatase [Gaiellaceae bacterium]
MSIASYAGASDTGRKRRRNEDSYVIAPPIFAVADGMGGAQAGEIASRLAAAALEDTDPGAKSGAERVTSLIQEANRRVHERAIADPSTSGMGTTMTVALVEGTTVTFGHVGDSRAYRFRDGTIEQITEDHSLVNELLKSGKLSPEEADTHPQRSVITRAVGTDPDVDVDSFTIDAEVGDVFLICSDGLTDMVDDEDIRSVLEKFHNDLDRATKSLVSAANRGGGEDNITVVAFEISEDGAETARMPAVDDDTMENIPVPKVDTMVVPPEEVEHVFVEPGSPEAAAITKREPITPAARVRLVLVMLVLLAVAAVLLVWGLVR